MNDIWTFTTYRRRLLTSIESTFLNGIAWATAFAVLTALLAQVRKYAPWNPYVPYTGQVVGVVLSGLVLGPRLGAGSMGLYLLLGAIGLPVFADASGGVSVLFGPTAGYLFGFVVASYTTGLLSRSWMDGAGAAKPARLALAALGGLGLAFVIGSMILGVTGVLATKGLGQTLLVSSILVVAASILWSVWSKTETNAFLARIACGIVGVLLVYGPGVVVLHLATGLPVETAISFGALQFIPVDLAKVFLAAGLTAGLLPPVTDPKAVHGS